MVIFSNLVTLAVKEKDMSTTSTQYDSYSSNEGAKTGQALAAALVAIFALLIIILCLHSHRKSLWLWKRRPKLPPGPPACPLIGHLHLMGKLPHQSLHRLANKYGSFMYLRLGLVPVVVVSNAEMARHFLHTHDKNFASRPRMNAVDALAYGQSSVSFSPYNHYLQQMKKILNEHLLSVKRLEESKYVRSEEVSLLLQSIFEDHLHNREVNLLDKVCTMSNNIISRLLIDRRIFNDDDGQEAERFKSMGDQMSAYLGAVNIGDYLPYLKCLDLQGYDAKMRNLHIEMDAFLKKVIARYEEVKGENQGSRPTDVLDVLLWLASKRSKTHQQLLNDTSIKAMILNIFIAGTRTCTNTVHWAMSEILRHPGVLDKARQELNDLIGTKRKLQESDTTKLTYLQAIVKETFRLHPPTPLLLPHESMQDCNIAGYDIPKKTRLLVNTWALGRDPSVWERPLEFDPERFIRSNHIDVRGQHFELLPFGSGRRACPGLSMGLIVVHFTLASLIHSFDWGLPAGQRAEEIDMRENPGMGLSRASPLLAIATPRLHSQLYTPQNERKNDI
ncbi:hypothetical protein O6H91_02G035100 [Diphasiastrum complanatum]|uniref:Uncharacterized protein n=2 Tax=Diphasiastrum complanatum TaxID=34168 RepID=A0ACC2EDY9_DIPCM|nr:hypothetical protein O6H91_02G035100 [Diphasiastrum complanatum]KAJ7564824.1 hypothetical protein O6H91_02G035100 [Diphasiastrum complanatum]